VSEAEPSSKCKKEKAGVGTHQPPRIRRLAKGTSASEHARKLAAEQVGWVLPPGMTFVRAHYRGGKIVHDYPNEPRLRYNDDIFQELIGGE